MTDDEQTGIKVTEKLRNLKTRQTGTNKGAGFTKDSKEIGLRKKTDRS